MIYIEINNKTKRTCHQVDFAIPTDNRVKINESEKIGKYLNLARERKKNKTVRHEGDGDTNCSWCTWNGLQRIRKETRRTGNQRKTTALQITASILRRALKT